MNFRRLLLILILLVNALYFGPALIAHDLHDGFSFTSGNIPNEYHFYPTQNNTGSTFQFTWNFGDGMVSHTASPTHTYTSPGNHNVCLNVYDPQHHTQTNYCNTITGGHNCNTTNTTCYFIIRPDSTSPFNFDFIAQLPLWATATWDFGDSTTGTGSTVSHTFASTGTFNVCLTIYDSAGVIMCSHCDVVHVTGVPTGGSCNFTANQDSLNLLLLFFHAQCAPGTLVIWTFDDGTAGTGVNESHLYASQGIYHVCMTVMDSLNGTILCTHCDDVVAGHLPTGGNCQFFSFPDSVNQFQYYFITQAPAGTTIEWDFGDSTTGTGNNTSHIYNTTGHFNVCMSVIDTATGLVLCTHCDDVFPGLHTGGNCNFSFAEDSVNHLLVYFTAQAPSGSIVNWIFGDNTSGNGTSVSHLYVSGGYYTVCMSAVDTATGNVICNECHSVHVSGNPVFGNCYFTHIADTAHGLAVLFWANTNSGTFVNWDFGDSTTATGSYLSHTYLFPGHYNVCVTITDSITGDTLCTHCDNISVSSGPGGGTCGYTFVPDSANQFLFYFSAQVNSGTTVTWTFGDGTSGSGVTTSHTYNHYGNYTVCMEVRDSVTNHLLCTECHQVNIVSHGNCAISYMPDSVNGLIISFATGATPGVVATWEFGDSTTAIGGFVTHTYPSAGWYTVCVTITDSITHMFLCHSCLTINVHNGPLQNCGFTFVPDTTNPALIHFAAQASPGTSIQWSFGDGTGGVGQFISHTFSAPGGYLVCMTVIDTLTNTILCTSCHQVAINHVPPACQANFVAVHLGLTGYFIELSNLSPAGASYLWDFGDGSTSNVRFVQHTYAAAGTYTVCLSISNLNGCQDQYCAPVTVDTLNINPSACSAYFVTLQLAPYQIAVINLSSGVNLAFNWDFGDGTTANGPYPSHYYNSTGSFVLCLTVSDNLGCSSTYCDTVSVDSLGNIFRLSSSSGFILNVLSPAQLISVPETEDTRIFSMYPNPVKSTLVVSLGDGFGAQTDYMVMTMSGGEILKGTFYLENNELNVESWNSGIYLLELTNSDGSKNYKKIVKE